MKDLRLKIKNQKGIVLAVVMSFMALMILNMGSLLTMVQRDIKLIKSIKYSEQTIHVAEAGIHDALARLKNGEFSEGFPSGRTISESLGGGASYVVAFSEISGRKLITSVGTVTGSDISETATVEIRDSDDMMRELSASIVTSAVTQLSAKDTLSDGFIDIKSSMHSHEGYMFFGSDSPDGINIMGSVSASTGSGRLITGEMTINGIPGTSEIILGASPLVIPTLDYDVFRQAAIDANDGSYYPDDADLSGLRLRPGNGIIYVEGTATMRGNTTLRGGIVANEIRIESQGGENFFKQRKKTNSNMNVIIAKNGWVRFRGSVEVEEALIYGSRIYISGSSTSTAEIDGIILGDVLFITVEGEGSMVFNSADVRVASAEYDAEIISWNS